ncbi:MAG: hypothetical protein FJ279_21930 [Planctomycetes bacterium]|nr:hypothetical protein [Planctomycetota bacterium]
MRFLVDEDLPRGTEALLRSYGHEAKDVRDIGLRGAKDHQIAAHARSTGLCLVTGDQDFSDIRNYPPESYHGIVVLKVPNWATASFILNVLESFLQRHDLLEQVPGRLAIVEPGWVRIRAAQRGDVTISVPSTSQPF